MFTLTIELFRDWPGLVLLLLASTACEYHSPAAPTPPEPISATAPATLTLGAAVGIGVGGGRAIVTAKIQNGYGVPLANVAVTFSSDVGVITPEVTTGADGTASATLIATRTATVTAQAASLTTRLLVASGPAGSAPPTPLASLLNYSVTLAASPSSLAAGGSSLLTATVVAADDAPTPTSYAWDCHGDGTTIITSNINVQSCAYPIAGTFTSKVTVTGGLVSGSASTTVTVAAMLTVLIVPASFAPVLGTSNNFTATVTSSDLVPASLQWEWDVNGDGTYDLTVAGAPSPNTQALTFGTQGVQTVKVRVTDVATSRIAIGTVQVTVP